MAKDLPLTPGDDSLTAALAPLVAAGKTIEAIKHYRQLTGASLAEAKRAVEQLRDHGKLPELDKAAAVQLKPTDEAALLKRLRAGKPVEAIRLYREQTGADLKDSKLAIELLAQRHNIPLKLSGCGIVIAIGVLGLLFIIGLALLLFWQV